MTEMSYSETVPQLAKTAQHGNTAVLNGLMGDVKRMVATNHLRIRYSVLKSLCLACSCIFEKWKAFFSLLLLHLALRKVDGII